MFSFPVTNAALSRQLAAIQLSLSQLLVQNAAGFAALKTYESQGVSQIMGSFHDDVATLTTAVNANTAALASIQTLVTADTASIANLTAQVAALQAADPTLDLTGLETEIAALQANNVTAMSIAAPSVPAGTPPPPPPPPNAPPA